jgi:hypothetical protein
MTTSTHLIRLTRLLVLGAVIAGTGASVAGADTGRRPAVQDAAMALQTTPAGLKADGLRLQGIARMYQQAQSSTVRDVGSGATFSVTDRIVDDSFRDSAPIATPAGDRIVDDSFRDAPTVVVPQSIGGAFHWADFGIGAGAMLGLTLLLAVLSLGALSLRHRSGRFGTS